MQRWLVSVPAWGPRCVDVFCATALPALELAMLRVKSQCEVEPILVCHTDQPERVVASATEIRVDARPVPVGLRDFDCLSQSHREVLRMGSAGDVVVLLTADLVIPRSGLIETERLLQHPRIKLVMCASIRCLQEGQLPEGLHGGDLMKWAWANKHPMTTECTWPDGLSGDLSRIYFTSETGAVTSRLCLPHPLAVELDGRDIVFTPTIDANLMQCWHKNEMAMAQDATVLGLVELSPRDKAFGVGDEKVVDRVNQHKFRITNPNQQWCFSHQVRMIGEAKTCDDVGVANSILNQERMIQKNIELREKHEREVQA